MAEPERRHRCSILDRPPDVEHFRAQLAAAVVDRAAADGARRRRRSVASARRCGGPTPSSTSTTTSASGRAAGAGHDAAAARHRRRAIYQDPYDRTRPLWMMHVIERPRGRPGGAGCGRSTTPSPTAPAPAACRSCSSSRRARPRAARRRPRRPSSPPPSRPTRRSTAAVAGRARSSGRRPTSPARQAGIARRVVGEVAMWGADPLRARRRRRERGAHRRPARTQITGGRRRAVVDRVTPSRQLPGGSPLWRSRSRHRHLEVLSFPLDDALAAAKGLGGSLNDWFVTGVVNGGVALPRGARRAAAHAEHELRGEHARRQGDRRQLVHADPLRRAGRPDGTGGAVQR